MNGAMHLLEFLIRHFWLLGILGMAAGAAALGGEGGGSAGEISGGGEGGAGEAGEIVGEGAAAGEGDGAGEGEGAGEGDGHDDPNVPLYKSAKAALEKIRAENPALAKKIHTQLIRIDRADKALPEGFEKAATMVKEVEGLAYPGTQGQPIEQILQSAKAELQGWREFDVKISKGDPAIIEELVTATPEGFQSLIPAALNKYAEVNPDGYSTLVTQAVVADMDSSQIPLQMKLMETFLPRLPDSPEKSELIRAYNSVIGWVNKIRGFAAKPIVAVKGNGSAENQPSKEEEQAKRETDITRREWNARSTGRGHELISSETARILGATKPTDQQRQQITAKVAEELDARLAANREYGAAMRAFLANKNYEGYKRRLHSEYQKLIPGAVRRAIDDLGIKASKGAAKPGEKPGQKPGPGNARPGGKAAEGFERIAGPPRTIKGMPMIDLVATTHSMLMNRQAILKGGRKVRW
jgi:hypothetical protein